MKYQVAYTTTNSQEVKFAVAFGNSPKGAMMPIRRKEGKGVVADYAAVNSQYIKNTIKAYGFEMEQFAGKTREQVVAMLLGAEVIALKAEILANYIMANPVAVAEVEAAPAQPVAVAVSNEKLAAQVTNYVVIEAAAIAVAKELRHRKLYLVTATHYNTGKPALGFFKAKSADSACDMLQAKFSYGKNVSIIENAKCIEGSEAICAIFKIVAKSVSARRDITATDLANILDNASEFVANDFVWCSGVAKILANAFNSLPK